MASRLPFYEPSSRIGPLAQGELLQDVWEHRAIALPNEPSPNDLTPVESERHDFAFVLNAACDLQWDYEARQKLAETQGPGLRSAEAAASNTLVPCVLLCDAYLRESIRPLVEGRDIWRRIDGNTDIRYHHFASAPVREGNETIDEVFVDFKKTFSVPTQLLYDAIGADGITRVGVVPPVYVHDIQRYFAFHSRVGLPDP